MGGLTWPIPRSHSWGLSPTGDCLVHLEVLKGFSKRGPNKQGIERTLWGTRARQRNGSSVLMVGSSLSPPLVMMKGDLSIASMWIIFLPRCRRDDFTVVKAHSN